MIDFKLMEERYGKNWMYFMPPNARPFHRISNTEALNPATIPLEAQPFEIRSNPLTTTQREIAVIQLYKCVATQAAPNPYWLGRMPIELSPYAFQGRLQWTVMLNTERHNDLSVLGGVTYQNTPAAVPLTPASRMGISLLREYSVGNGAPPLVVPAGARAYVGLYSMPDLWGANPPPVDSPPIVFVTELVGYYLDYSGMPNPQSSKDAWSSAIPQTMSGGQVR